MRTRKVDQPLQDEVAQKFPKGQRVTLYGGTVEGTVKGYRRTNLNGTLVIVEYVNRWSDGYSETRRMQAVSSQLTVVK